MSIISSADLSGKVALVTGANGGWSESACGSSAPGFPLRSTATEIPANIRSASQLPAHTRPRRRSSGAVAPVSAAENRVLTVAGRRSSGGAVKNRTTAIGTEMTAIVNATPSAIIDRRYASKSVRNRDGTHRSSANMILWSGIPSGRSGHW